MLKISMLTIMYIVLAIKPNAKNLSKEFMHNEAKNYESILQKQDNPTKEILDLPNIIRKTFDKPEAFDRIGEIISPSIFIKITKIVTNKSNPYLLSDVYTLSPDIGPFNVESKIILKQNYKINYQDIKHNRSENIFYIKSSDLNIQDAFNPESNEIFHKEYVAYSPIFNYDRNFYFFSNLDNSSDTKSPISFSIYCMDPENPEEEEKSSVTFKEIHEFTAIGNLFAVIELSKMSLEGILDPVTMNKFVPKELSAEQSKEEQNKHINQHYLDLYIGHSYTSAESFLLLKDNIKLESDNQSQNQHDYKNDEFWNIYGILYKHFSLTVNLNYLKESKIDQDLITLILKTLEDEIEEYKLQELVGEEYKAPDPYPLINPI
ncbi:hypothetical protein [Candidatus Nesciobacter abundans]|uniref:Uncharacterized protein n=2 Tax=Candidatus Nesciobacter abundans TaxID=2601668 RepID=A0A5C0UHH4_9PROT|nr:hypothetical protein [Candidatus Nesciobacter abundans]QEK39013.1 hypothetical protein FZC36_01005 [Candidatus Nesciobacter abundans]